MVVGLALAVVGAACAPPGSPGSGATGDVVSAVNQDRAMAGLPPLVWDTTLYQLATAHADDIAARGTLWHLDLESWHYVPWMAHWRAFGQNLVVGSQITGWSAVDIWMGSPPHRANILNPGFTHIGVGVKVDGAGRAWIVALFGTR